MVKAVRREDAQVFPLPGRDWLLYVGPESTDARNLTLGWATFPPGSAPPGHVHPTQEEVVPILSGHAEPVTPPGAQAHPPPQRRGGRRGGPGGLRRGRRHFARLLGREPESQRRRAEVARSGA